MVQTVELPRVPGYVETVVGGRHVYRNVETGEITDHPTPPETGPTAEELLNIMLGVADEAEEKPDEEEDPVVEAEPDVEEVAEDE